MVRADPMTMTRLFLGMVLCGFAASCATDKGERVVPLNERSMAERFGGGGKIRQDANGNWSPEVRNMYVPEANRKSAYGSGGTNQSKPYKTGEYAKTSWWGGKSYERKSYGDTPDGSRFQSTARDQHGSAREGGSEARGTGVYQTGSHPTGGAREGRAGDLGTPESGLGGREHPEGEVIGWKEQRRMDMNAVKSRMGRN